MVYCCIPHRVVLYDRSLFFNVKYKITVQNDTNCWLKYNNDSVKNSVQSDFFIICTYILLYIQKYYREEDMSIQCPLKQLRITFVSLCQSSDILFLSSHYKVFQNFVLFIQSGY